MKRNEAQDKYKWNFTNLYADRSLWEKDLQKIDGLVRKISNLKGKLNKKENFVEYLNIGEEFDSLIVKLVVYLHYGDTDQTNTTYQELEGLLMNEWQKISIASSFTAPEIKAIGEKTILEWIDSDKELKRYRLGYENFFKEAQYVLSEHDEELLSKVSRSRGAIDGMYDSLAFADNQEQKIQYRGKNEVVTNAFQLDVMQNSDPIEDQDFRRKLAIVANQGFVDKKHSFAKVYEGILQGETESVNLRGFTSALQASLLGDNVPVDVYLKLLEVGKKNIKPFKDYNLVIKRAFKLDKIYATDRQLKLVKEYNKKFTVEEAQSIIKKALGVLGDEYLAKLDKAWAPNHIDYYEDTNKRSGAYSTGGHGVDPIILMNWDDTLNSVGTLAHESGHSVHTLFADENQPWPLSEYPIILAEVASTMNEHLLFDYQYNTAQSNDEKIYLLQRRIFDLVSTFYRQIQFADFEYRAHELVQKQLPQTADSLAKLFADVQLDYGYDVYDKDVEENARYVWPRVSHFFHSPYYVYKYAIDVTASFKLYEDVQKGNVQNILNFLKAGGSKNPLDVMKDAGIDFTKEATYQPLIDNIAFMVRELDKLVK